MRFGSYLKNYDQYGVGHRTIFASQDNVVYAIIFADFSFNDKKQANNKAHLYGGGAVDTKTLQSLEQRTHTIRRDISEKGYDSAVLWVTHFAPYQVSKNYLELTNYQHVINTASRCGVYTILCGHTHENKIELQSNVTVFCAGAATSVDCDNMIHELVLSRDGGISNHQNRRWKVSSGIFE